MKLLYITNGIHGAAGLERVLSIKASYLADVLGYKVHIMTLNSAGKAPFYDFSDRIAFHDVSAGGNPFHYIKQYQSGIRNLVKQLSPDVISVCDDGLKGFFIPTILNRKVPVIYERHVSKIIALGADPSLFKKLTGSFKFALMNHLGKSFDRFVVLTTDNISEWNLPNIKVISNPLSFNPADVSTLQNKKVIAVGKQSYQKGFDRLLESWSIAIKEHPDWKLEIYGKFDPSQKLVELAKDLQISDSVNFYAPEKNILEKYLDSSIYALSSRFEGFGMVLIEAMVCGVPCVSFDCPCGPRDIIKNGEDGFLVENGSTSEFAVKLSLLMSDQDLRIQIGSAARENVQRFLPETIMPQWDGLFKSLAR